SVIMSRQFSTSRRENAMTASPRLRFFRRRTAVVSIDSGALRFNRCTSSGHSRRSASASMARRASGAPTRYTTDAGAPHTAAVQVFDRAVRLAGMGGPQQRNEAARHLAGDLERGRIFGEVDAFLGARGMALFLLALDRVQQALADAVEDVAGRLGRFHVGQCM